MSVEGLAREIGATFDPTHETRAFELRWVKKLATIIGPFVGTRCAYADQTLRWLASINAAGESSIEQILEAIREEITERDCDDGWATDRIGSMIEYVCLALQPNTRWLAHAAQHVWRGVTGCTAYNRIVSYSQTAWLRHLYEECAKEGP